MKHTIFLLLFFITACTGSAPGLIDYSVSSKSAPTTIQTATINAQATIDVANADAQQARGEAQQAQEFARAAQLTSDAANRLLVDATVTHEAIQLSYAQMTQEADRVAIQREDMTRVSSVITATAYATSIPLTATQQSLRDSIRTTEVALTVNAPAIKREMVTIELQDTYGGLAYFAQVLASIALLIIPVGMLLYLFRSKPPKDTEYQETSFISPTPDPLPFVVEPNGNRMIRAVIPFPPSQLNALAEGVNNGLTLGINQWQGTIVHKSIDTIRAFMVHQKFAKEIPGKAGELIIEPAGETFLQYVVEHRSPPPPFQFV